MTQSKDFISDLLNEKSIFQSYLDVEAALARAQAALGVIPQWAADIISEKSNLELLNMENVYSGLEKTGHPLVPLIWELDRVCGPQAGGYIHWGATTQNITQTGNYYWSNNAMLTTNRNWENSYSHWQNLLRDQKIIRCQDEPMVSMLCQQLLDIKLLFGLTS